MKKHNNDTMSLAVYLVVEKPNRQLQQTLADMHKQEPIVSIRKQPTGNIEAWSRKCKESDADGKMYDVYTRSMIDTASGIIIGSREERQLLNNNMINFR